MECVYIKKAKHLRDHVVFIEFNDGVYGAVDLKEIIWQHPCAAALRDVTAFSKFYLDEWPTLAWSCGCDIAPETLHGLCIGATVEANAA